MKKKNIKGKYCRRVLREMQSKQTAEISVNVQFDIKATMPLCRERKLSSSCILYETHNLASCELG